MHMSVAKLRDAKVAVITFAALLIKSTVYAHASVTPVPPCAPPCTHDCCCCKQPGRKSRFCGAGALAAQGTLEMLQTQGAEHHVRWEVRARVC